MKVLMREHDLSNEYLLFAQQIDHLPDYASDDRHQKIGSAYAVGYVKALLAALKA